MNLPIRTSPVATGCFWGLSPPNWNMKHYKSVEILSIFRVSSPPQKRKASVLKTFWRRFCSEQACRTGSLQKFWKMQRKMFSQVTLGLLSPDKGIITLQFSFVMLGFVLLSECHEWSAASISACLRREPRGCLRIECRSVGKSMAAPHMNCSVQGKYWYRGLIGRKYCFSSFRHDPGGNRTQPTNFSDACSINCTT